MLRALIVGLTILGSTQFVIAQDRAPTVPDSIVDGMQVVDPLAFQATAAAWNTFAVRAAQLALERSQEQAVRDPSSMLIAEHADWMTALSLAAQTDQLPTAPVEGLDGRQSGMMGKLEASTEAEFDRLFLTMQRTAHQEAIGLFKGFAENGSGRLRAFASERLPILEVHLEEIDGLMPTETPS